MVSALDRLGRSQSGVISTIETLTEAGVLLRSLREGVDYSTATGRILAGTFPALARLRTGTDARPRRRRRSCRGPRPRPPHPDRPARLTNDRARQVRSLHAGGGTIADLVRGFGVSRATIYRALQQAEAVESSASG